ncbi:MAG: hypothetical protein R2727_06740 [Bacteroidales bacterium]
MSAIDKDAVIVELKKREYSFISTNGDMVGHKWVFTVLLEKLSLKQLICAGVVTGTRC